MNLDDFGAGHSNLSWFQDLPISGLKIDRRFVASLDVPEGRGTAIVQGLLGLGHAFGLPVVGEGVETVAQANALREMGCELGQGYQFAYPGTSEQLWAFVKRSTGNGSAGHLEVPAGPDEAPLGAGMTVGPSKVTPQASDPDPEDVAS